MGKATGAIKLWAWISICIGGFILFISSLFVISAAILGISAVYDILEETSNPPLLIAMFVSGLLSFMAGILMLRLREIGRKIYLFVTAADLLWLTYHYLISGIFLARLEDKPNALVAFVMSSVLPIGLIYYFTRPKVKVQFT